MRQELEVMAYGLPIFFTGNLSANEVLHHIAESKLLVMPSEWWEGFPMVIREAYAYGTPVAASKIGSLEEIVEDEVTGFHFQPSNDEAIYKTLYQYWNNHKALERFSYKAQLKFKSHFSEKVNYNLLMTIYDSILN